MKEPNQRETERARRDLHLDRRCRFVGRGRFEELLVSTRHLNRADEPRARAFGLIDPRTGFRFLIEEEKLFSEAG